MSYFLDDIYRRILWTSQAERRIQLFTMIEPTPSDIGRKVIYTGNHYPGGKLEEGVITSFNDCSVFVRYGSDYGSKGTNRQDLEWI